MKISIKINGVLFNNIGCVPFQMCVMTSVLPSNLADGATIQFEENGARFRNDGKILQPLTDEITGCFTWEETNQSCDGIADEVMLPRH